MNLNFYNMNTNNPCGVLILDGKIISKNVYNRPYLIVFKDGSSRITTEDIKKLDLNNVKYATGGGSYVFKDGKSFISSEHFTSSFLNANVRRSIIGIDNWGNLVIVAIRNANLYKASRILSKLNIKDAINMDGGTSTQMYYKNKYVFYSKRRVPVIIIIN